MCAGAHEIRSVDCRPPEVGSARLGLNRPVNPRPWCLPPHRHLAACAQASPLQGRRQTAESVAVSLAAGSASLEAGSAPLESAALASLAAGSASLEAGSAPLESAALASLAVPARPSSLAS